MPSPYPFSAVVGLDDLRLALLMTAVSPAVGGVLVRGEKGTAKSTVVRALATLLPPVDVVRGCRFACDPAAPDPGCPDGPHEPDAPHAHRPATLVELLVGATEDRVVGTLDIQRALADWGEGLRAGAAGGGAPGRALRRRGQPAAGPPGRPAAGRGGDGPRARRAGRIGAGRIGAGRIGAGQSGGAPVVWHKMGEGWSWIQRPGTERDHAAEAAEGWANIKRDLAAETHRFYVLDEFTYPMKRGWVVVATRAERPGNQHVVITGRDAHPDLLAAADLVTEMTKVKHPMDAGRKGQRGIEW